MFFSFLSSFLLTVITTIAQDRANIHCTHSSNKQYIQPAQFYSRTLDSFTSSTAGVKVLWGTFSTADCQ